MLRGEVRELERALEALRALLEREREPDALPPPPPPPAPAPAPAPAPSLEEELEEEEGSPAPAPSLEEESSPAPDGAGEGEGELVQGEDAGEVSHPGGQLGDATEAEEEEEELRGDETRAASQRSGRIVRRSAPLELEEAPPPPPSLETRNGHRVWLGPASALREEVGGEYGLVPGDKGEELEELERIRSLVRERFRARARAEARFSGGARSGRLDSRRLPQALAGSDAFYRSRSRRSSRALSVAILMDESGSMRGVVRGDRCRSSVLAPVAAGLGEGLELLEGVEVRFFGHSAGAPEESGGWYLGGSQVVRVDRSRDALGDRCEPTLLREYRSALELLRVRPMGANNRDGEAVRAIARELLEEPGAASRDLVILSISDGAPAAQMIRDDVPGSEGPMVTSYGARGDLLEALETVRELGVHVFAFGYAECAGIVGELYGEGCSVDGELENPEGAVGAFLELVSSRLMEGI